MVSGVGDWIRSHRVVSFFFLAYAISWSLDASVLLLGMEPSRTRWITSGFLGAPGPAIAAAVVLSVSGESLRDWLGRVVRWRVHPKWYSASARAPGGPRGSGAAAIGAPAIVALGSGAVLHLVGGPVDFESFAFDPVSLGIGCSLEPPSAAVRRDWAGAASPSPNFRRSTVGCCPP